MGPHAEGRATGEGRGQRIYDFVKRAERQRESAWVHLLDLQSGTWELGESEKAEPNVAVGDDMTRAIMPPTEGASCEC